MLKNLLFIALLYPTANAAIVNFSGTFNSDGDLRLFHLDLATNSTISVRTYSYGGSTSPSTPSGGFAPSLALYSSAGELQISDNTGGTWNGSACSNGAQRDLLTGFCQDATLNFNGIASNYTLVLSVQGNNGPSLLSDPFTLNPGDNFNPGPFADPGDPTGLTIRSGNWAVEISLNGSATDPSAIPEPSTAFTLGIAIAAMAAARRFQL